MKDYRVPEEQGGSMGSRQVVEKVVFMISDDAPNDSDDVEMPAFLRSSAQKDLDAVYSETIPPLRA